ncbi:UPF0175 family protein [cf. Phormidesmis sp. LEGE 11477]|uniref:UPF0175 family protein n=1 Tax=cf. Phormidesmis sp. LEGE 11477 TaxID=1828680 RepID=UPI0018824016|nr:UPF0175 family protein [cf. Phormidesmis sp. LEGE 11477]MBE9062534.1 UPF0175 family protein [cf. Phormidesmis sp. LEGE 11477]
MQITIELPNDIAERLTQRMSDLPRQTLEALSIEGYRNEILSHHEVGRILDLDWWGVEAFLKAANVCLHYDESDLEQDRKTIQQVRESARLA